VGAFLQLNRLGYLDKNLFVKQVGIASCFIQIFQFWHSKIGGSALCRQIYALAHGKCLNTLASFFLASTVLDVTIGYLHWPFWGSIP